MMRRHQRNQPLLAPLGEVAGPENYQGNATYTLRHMVEIAYQHDLEHAERNVDPLMPSQRHRNSPQTTRLIAAIRKSAERERFNR